jgi:hypothetical protein
VTTHGEDVGTEINQSAADASKPEEPGERAEQLVHEIDEIRDHLGGLVSELDQRRHRLKPVAVLRRNPWPFAVGGVMVVGLVIGSLALQRRRARERDAWVNQGKRLRSALRRAVERPDQVAKVEPNIGMKVLSTAATAMAAVAARRLAIRLFARTP